MRQTAFEENLGTLAELDASRRLPRATATIRRVPYDYVAVFPLTGRRGSTVSAAINISAEATFICTTIGYSLEEPEAIPDSPGIVNLSPTLGVVGLLRGTLRTSATNLNRGLQAEQIAALQTQNIRDNLSFKYAIIDKGSGRELQNTPVHNMAGLGRADGVRPFRELAVPYVFAPNSSISIELYEIVTIPGGKIHMDFQGYKEFR
jgi:hypothetical protein